MSIKKKEPALNISLIEENTQEQTPLLIRDTSVEYRDYEQLYKELKSYNYGDPALMTLLSNTLRKFSKTEDRELNSQVRKILALLNDVSCSIIVFNVETQEDESFGEPFSRLSDIKLPSSSSLEEEIAKLEAILIQKV
jgi:hypothetical protein